MDLSTRILGAGVVHGLQERAGKAVLVIGSDRFRRADLADVGCFNFIAAAHLESALKALGARSARDVFEHVPPDSLVVPGVGSISLAVLGAVFEAKKIGGEHPLETWAAKHRGADALVTFDTLKAKEHKREIGETRARKARRERRHARRDKAQRLRVDRFTTRHERENSSHA